MQISKSLTIQPHFILRYGLTVQATLVFAFVALTAVGAWVEIPTQPVPFTLQTFFVLLSGVVLGARNAFFSQLIYLSLGIIGLPLFAGFSFGFAKLIGPTGGYLLSFPIAAFVTGYLVTLNGKYIWTIISVTVGMLIIFSFGTVYLNFIFFNDIAKSLMSGFLIFSWWDAIKIFAVASIYHQLRK
ncbi:MAG: biotin transporter BioY [Bacteroidota bacterium]|nr:biotin transporter BioY [Bacteroidota bacterium]